MTPTKSDQSGRLDKSVAQTVRRVPRWQSLLRSFALARDPLAVLDATLDRYGDTVELYIGGVRKSLLTREPGLVQHVLQKNSRRYAKSEFTQDFARYVGRGLLTNEGPDWRRQRRLIQPGFHRQRVAGLTGLMQGIVAETLAPLAEQAAGLGGAVAVSAHALMTQLAFRIIVRSVFSTNLPETELARLADAITRLQGFYVRRIRQPYLKPWFWLVGRTREHDELAAELRGILGGHIGRRRPAADAAIPTPLALANPSAQPPFATPAPPDDLLQMLLDARYEDTGAAMAPERLLDEALILLVAGHETSANALTWLLYLLAQHPAEVARIQAEMATVLAGRAPTFADLPQLTSALYAVQEAMRLYPPAWMVDRVALADDEYEGLKIPRGTLFSLYLYGLHHDPKSWDAPAEFRPGRFAPEAAAQRHPFAYAPFGGGPRLCIGMQFALTEMQLVVLELLRHFNPELEAASKLPVPMQPLITLRPRHDFEVRLRLR